MLIMRVGLLKALFFRWRENGATFSRKVCQKAFGGFKGPF